MKEGSETMWCFGKKELAYAMLMGDGYLSPLTHGAKNSRLIFAQSINHVGYVDWLYEIASCFWKVKKFKRIVGCGFNDKKFVQYGFRTLTYPLFTHLRKNIFYKEGKKKINQRILSQLTPFALAVWYMDDGSLRFQESKRKEGKKGDRKLVLYTGGYSVKENKLIIDWFQKKHKIQWNLSSIRNQPLLYCGMREGLKFIELIKPYIHPTMKYKIDLKYQMLNKSPLKAEILRIFPEYKI